MWTSAILVARTLIRLDDRQGKRWFFLLYNTLLAFGRFFDHLLVLDTICLLLEGLVLLGDSSQLLLLALQGLPLVNLLLDDAFGPLEGLLTAAVHQVIEEIVLSVDLCLAQVLKLVIFKSDCVGGRGDEYHRHGHRAI